MLVNFKTTAFLGGVRYRAGLQEYGGPVSDLPDDAKVDGKLVGELTERKLANAKRRSDSAPRPSALEAKPFDEGAARQEIEQELRTSITEEFRQDLVLRQTLKDELRLDSDFRQQFADEIRPQVAKEEREKLLADADTRKLIYDEEVVKAAASDKANPFPAAKTKS